MPKKLKNAVVVITGASSGIGRATALQFAEKGSSLVLAARRDTALDEVVSECERLGARALAVPMDVSDEDAVNALARRAVEAFDRIDVWVNNAAVTIFGRFDETPSEDIRRLFDVNLFGYIWGARAALKVFREQGSGVLINVSSVVTRMPQPYTSFYTMSKHAIRAMSQSLRQELVLDKAKNIHVTAVFPASIDTPFFQHGANYTGRKPKAMPPVYPPENVARMIVRMAQHPKREVYVGNAGRMFNMQMKFMPAMAERGAATMVDQEHLSDTPDGPSPGNLYEPMPEQARIEGGWKGENPSGASRVAMVGAATVPALLVWHKWRNRDNGPAIGKAAKAKGALAIARKIRD